MSKHIIYELQQMNEALEKENWLLRKGRRVKIRCNLHDCVLEYIYKSDALRQFCKELESRETTIDVRDIKFNVSSSRFSTSDDILLI